MEHGTSEGRFLIEVNGISVCRATEVSGLDKKHEPFKLYESNRPNPHIGRAHFEISELTIKHAHALNTSAFEFFQWLDDFVKGVNVERRGMRIIVLDEDGATPVDIYECINCVPISMGPETHTAGGSNASYYKFTIKPEDMMMF
jgi:phage tail-like protein